MVRKYLLISNCSKEKKETNKENKKNSIYNSYLKLFNYVKKIILFEDYKYALKELLKIYFLMKIINIFNDKLLILTIINIIVFYSPIENKTDHFLFKGKMAVKQSFQGMIGLIECLIPRYEEPKNAI